jgi:hypothetical protein
MNVFGLIIALSLSLSLSAKEWHEMVHHAKWAWTSLRASLFIFPDVFSTNSLPHTHRHMSIKLTVVSISKKDW